MNHEQLAAEAATMGRWERHRFMILVAGTIVISLGLVGVALWLYDSSGAAQLDLSRPSYVSVREHIDQNDSFRGYPATGDVTSASLDEFDELYKTYSEKALGPNSFGGEVLSDKSLGLSDPALDIPAEPTN